MLEVVGGFPEIEHFVAILNRGEQRGETVAEETKIECDVQGEVEGRRRRTGQKLVISKNVGILQHQIPLLRPRSLCRPVVARHIWGRKLTTNSFGRAISNDKATTAGGTATCALSEKKVAVAYFVLLVATLEYYFFSAQNG